MIHLEHAATYDILMTFLSSFLVILFLILLVLICRNKRPPIESEESPPINQLSARQYSLMEVDMATDGFNPTRVIGRGRLGIVYAGISPNGDLIAVKRIHPNLVLSNASIGFSTTLKWLSLSHHPNIVQIKGFSEAPGERIVLTEFVGMLNLEYYLHENHDGVSLLGWSRRLSVAAGVARGIEYLHESMAPSIVHGCIKPSNILIDAKFGARVCDYGMWFMAPARVELGYVDRECLVEKKRVSKECDVYGLGVVMLEILSGRRSEGGVLVEWALPLIKEMRFNELLDRRLGMPSEMKVFVRLAKVASACVGNSRKNRPSIAHVSAILNNLEQNQEQKQGFL
ncbi:serine/threonine-protein kinase-like protein ACR4 [Impatiens glandulifera]|uniref:serine/threonine-protein kinase-like protein ACR4 n=1 Tax=Impatiens glandulifera TaxID=253017 RepID=UPI001FB11694|nr:serine/threonine-protein kinase-like protein ACR4 [Impatiens glandulifera]